MNNISKKIKNNKILINILIIILFIILSFTSMGLILHTHQFMGFSDNTFHLKRILELKSDILHGNFLPMFSFNQFHGSAVMSLYPYLNLYPIALLAICVTSRIAIMNICFLINEFLALVCSYYSSYTFNKSKRISLVFSIIYSMSATFLINGIDDYGLVTAMAIFPLVIFGCINLIKYNKYIELTLGFTFLIFSHVLSAIIGFIFVILWVVLNINKLNIHKIITIIKSNLLTALLTSIVWLPALIIRFENTKTFTPSHPLFGLYMFLEGKGIHNTLKLGLLDNVNGGIDLFVIIGIILSIIFYKYMNSILRKMFWISILICFFCSDKFPWHFTPLFVIKFFEMFQSTSRFYILPEILMIYATSEIVVKLMSHHMNNIMNGLGLFCIILFAIALQIGNQYRIVKPRLATPIITRTYFNRHIRGTVRRFPLAWTFRTYRLNSSSQFKYPEKLNYTPAHYDYYPQASIPKYYLINDNYGIYDNKCIKIHHLGYNTFKFNNRRLAEHITLPLMVFNNSHLKLYLDGHSVGHHPNKYRELVINHIRQGTHQLKIQYKPNIFMVLAKSIAVLLGLVWLFLALIRKNRI